MPVITVDYKPRVAFKPFHERKEQFGVMICHRRAGKTVAAIQDLQKRCLTCTKKRPRFAFMAPTRVRAKEIAWQYLKDAAKGIPGVKVSESELYVEYPNEGRVTIYGADNDRAMGLYLDGIIFDECDEISANVWDVVSPALADRDGWAVWIGILRGRHNLWKRYEAARQNPKFFTLMLRASQSRILTPEKLDEMKNDPVLGMGESAYAMQMECDINASIANAIYGAQMDEMRRANRIRNMTCDVSVPLFTFWDIGHSIRGDDWTIWLIQMVGRDIILLDYLACTGQAPNYYAAKVREWEESYKVRVAMNYLPHDGIRLNQVGKTAKDYLADAGMDRIKIVPRTPNLWNSINNVRQLMPRMYINHGPCSQTWRFNETDMPSGIDCLDYYCKKVEASTGLIQDVPVHNQYSHGADALRTFAEAYAQRMLEGTSEIASSGRKVEIVSTRDPQGEPKRHRQITSVR